MESCAPGGCSCRWRRASAPRRCTGRCSATSPTKPVRRFLARRSPSRSARRTSSRDVVTNETGGYNVPNLLPGTYQVDVKLPGFSTFTARDIAVRQGLDVRVDARLKLGALEESIIVSGAGGRSADRERRGAVADDEQTQLETMPTSGRAYQTALALMPGVAQPNYDQSGGSNNPTRAMAITRQRPAAEQHGRPARRRLADQPVLPADPGLQPQPRSHRDGQRRHQQLRRRSGDGRRRVGERAGEERHEHARGIAVRTRARTIG